MNKELFFEELKKLGINPTADQMQKLEIYYHTLVEWNAKTNLTAITKEEDVYLKHFYDSLTIVKGIDLTTIESLLDVGSGAGFPGIVLKIFYPHLKLDIIDANNKKIMFLNYLIQKLSLENITLIHNRAEKYALENKEKYDLVTARAVANLNTLIELCLPMVKVNGYFIAMKGNASEELKEISKELEILGGKIVSQLEFNLPIENSQRTIIKIVKTKKTPVGYPRVYDKIIKKPLK